MANARHLAWLKTTVSKWNAKRVERPFTPSLRHANFDGCNLSGVNLRGAQLMGASFRGAQLANAVLAGADLTGADFTGANLKGAKLTAAICNRTRLSNADLSDTDLSDAELRLANLSYANLQGMHIIRTNFSGAITEGMNVKSLPASDGVSIGLQFAQGLTQAQVEVMDGDTGVDLPEGLVHPSRWPVWEAAPIQTERDSNQYKSELIADEFVFISYSREDEKVALQFCRALAAESINVWWDQNIPAGDAWRERIEEKLRSASAVLTLWTARSVKSKAVAEEATRAQRDGRFVHARLDDAPLPYGFSETQYADLRKWDGTSDHPEMRKLVQALLDKLHPPSRQEISDRLASSAPIAAVIENGLITAKDSPPNVKPPIQNVDDLEARLAAQEILAKKALTALETLDNNLGEAIRFDLSHFLNQVISRPASWYILSDSIDDLRIYLDMGDDIGWPGSTRNTVDRLCRAHEALRPLLEPVQLHPTAPDAPLPPPQPDPKKITDEALREVVKVAEEVFKIDEADAVFAEPAIRAGHYLAVEIDDARNLPQLSQRSEEKKANKIRKALTGLAGFVRTAIASISFGVSGNLLTSPDAAHTLLKTLKKLLDALLRLF